ncbi:polyketide synthase type I [Calothrix parasitica NIES-267]|uniref:Phenolphthiocerol/phthiocerol polyketide synthase subunit E n=1 Tax=Calothrix parasitica NIES-267 TaxID=1973488 RepID=A0A1Z4LK98_9CYAN|nr:polyketide synthase type I [Calothrix parasitica NIES-267]
MTKEFTQERILSALKEARTKLEAVEKSKNERVAIVGMAGRFPGANNVDEFWQNLCNGVNSIQFLSDEELLSAGVDTDTLNSPNYVKAYSSFADFDGFDASFFGYSPREAEVIDPQHRVFLECAWSALEQAGYDPEQYEGAIGVYGGSSLNSYIINLYSNSNLRANTDNVQAVISNVMGLMPTRVSYKLNLTGPSCGVQTGCSTSLVSVHLACQSLLNDECNMALAGGVSVGASGKSGYLYQADGVLSPDGYCRSFDARGEGTVFGNGVGIVVLKKLSDAIADGDCIYAVIKGSGINNDGSQKVGLTAPSVTGQANVIATTLEKAGIKPETIGYIETHGTGTALGDPIEISALNKVFRQHTKERKICALASVKSNIGHLDAAAGIAGLIKAALAVKYGKIPPSLNFESPNPQIDFDNSPFYVNNQLQTWESNGTPRRAAVSSFGMGGTNAHIVLEENLTPSYRTPLSLLRRGEENHTPLSLLRRGDGEPLRWAGSPTCSKWRGEVKDSSQLLLISAKTKSALKTATANLGNYLKSHQNVNLADIAYTLQIGRQALEQRRFIVCQNHQQAIQILSNINDDSSITKTSQAANKTLVFMFSGQGSQYENMGRELYETQSVFRETVDNCCTLLKPHIDFDLRTIIYPSLFSPSLTPSLPHSLTDTIYAQPAIFVIEYALAQLWMSWGIRPQAAIGHSIGEYVAGAIANVFSLEDALEIVALRGQLMQKCPTGSMLAVSLTESQVKPYLALNSSLTIAVINSSKMCVVSGNNDAIKQLEESLTAQEISCRRLHTSHAFHSPMMESAVKPLVEKIGKIKLNSPSLPFISNVTGTWITPEQATDPNYWGNHLRQTVRFADGINEVLQQSSPILLEVGAGRTLSTIAKQAIANQKQSVPSLTSLRHPQEKKSDEDLILNALGQLWELGVKVDWNGFYQGEKRQRIPLPTYPFERKRYWVERQENSLISLEDDLQKTKKSDITDWFYLPSWKRSAPLASNSLASKLYILNAEEEGGKRRGAQSFSWVLFVDEYGLGLQLAQDLQRLEQDVIIVKAGKEFYQQDESYTIKVDNREDYDRLFEDLQVSGINPQKIVHLWQLGTDINDSSAEFEHLLYLTQAIAKYQTLNQDSTTVELSVVTNELHDVIGIETINPDRTTILGLCKVIPQEYPQIRCRNIDVVIPNRNNQSLENTAIDLITELTTPTPDSIVAYRNRHRWIQSFESLPIPEANTKTLPLKNNGVYLIAGDLIEGLGLVFAQYLAQKFQAKLILIGRSGIPEKHDWEKWLATHGQNDAISNCIRKLQGLEALGQGLLFFSADLTDEAKIPEIIEKANQHFGDINGIIHAGVMGDRASCLIKSFNSDEIKHQFGSKVHGLLNLEKALQNKTPDFYLLQSSLSCIVGGVGFSAYAGANIFMDTLARERSKQGSTPWLTINWDACQLEENENNSTGSALLDLAMTPAEVWEVTERILSQSVIPQIVVTPIDLQTRINESKQTKLIDENQQSNTYTRPELSTNYEAPRNEIEQKIADAMQDLLGIEKVGIHDNFFELGGHSLLAIQAVTRIRKEWNVELPMRQFLFESPTVAGIAKIVSENLNQNQSEFADMLEQIEQMETGEVEEILRDTELGN